MSSTATELLDTFESKVKQSLDPFLLSKGAHYQSGFSTFEDHPVKLRSRGNNIPGLFSFICRYSLLTTYLEIGFGDRESIVEARLYYPQTSRGYNPADLVEAAQRDAEGLSGSIFVLQTAFMERTVDQLCNKLKKNWDILECPSPTLFDLAQSAIQQRIARDQIEQHREKREQACIQASYAFHTDKYAQTVALLEPFMGDDDLPKSASKMLLLATKKLASQG